MGELFHSPRQEYTVKENSFIRLYKLVELETTRVAN